MRIRALQTFSMRGQPVLMCGEEADVDNALGLALVRANIAVRVPENEVVIESTTDVVCVRDDIQSNHVLNEEMESDNG